MKNLIYILLAVLILVACDENDPTNPTPEPELCPAPVEIPGIGYHRPPAHQLQTVSYDYNFLAFKNHQSKLKVLSLNGGSVDEYNLNDYLPDSVRMEEIEQLDFSPYSYEVMILARTLTDTLGTQTEFEEGRNLYVFDINRKVLENISPDGWGKAGNSSERNNCIWLPQSSENKDYFLIVASMYIPQEKVFKDLYNDSYSRMSYYSFVSNDGNYIVTFSQYEPGTKIEFYYTIIKNNGILYSSVDLAIFGYDTLSRASKISWSPDNKYMAITASTQYRSEEPAPSEMYCGISIVDTEEVYENAKVGNKWIEHPNIIYPRKEFCMYMFGGTGLYGEMDTEFISDTTMAVSMHEDGAEYSYLYEISIHGEMIRQLTFEP